VHVVSLAQLRTSAQATDAGSGMNQRRAGAIEYSALIDPPFGRP
jgi:hypothetical protein